MAGRWTVGIALMGALVLLAAACRSEPSPTVAAPPNPTSAPASVLPGCVVDPGARAPARPTGQDYRIAQPGILVAGSVTSLPPFESVQGGQPAGFDVALIAEVARRLGLRPEVQTETRANLLSDVAQGRTDVAISALTIRADRKSVVDFTDPYFTADLALTVGAGQARGFPGVGALAGKVVGVAGASSAETCARFALQPRAKLAGLQPYADMSKAFTDLAVGRLGAVLADVPTSNRLVQAVPGVQIVQIYRTGDNYGIAVARSNPNLREVINRILADIRADGTYALIYRTWFQVPPPGT